MAREKLSAITCIDIGTANVVAVMGDQRADGSLHVLGHSCQPFSGLKRGVVVNIEATVAAIRAAIEEVELMSGHSIHEVYATISGNHIRGLNSHGIVAIRHQEVHAYDIERVLDAAKAVPIGSDRRILHVIPQDFVVDSQDSVSDPIGMVGVRLEARVHVVTTADSAFQNMVKCLEQCDLHVQQMVLGHVAASQAMLTRDEKDLGVCLIDVGAGTTDIAVYGEGALRHTAVIPIAGDQITNDIAVALRTPTRIAEEIKKQHACTRDDLCGDEPAIQVPMVSDHAAKSVQRSYLARVVEARVEELLLLIKSELVRSGSWDRITTGFVLTGGSVRIPGFDALAERVFGLPVRVSRPVGVQAPDDVLNNPVYDSALGLLAYAAQQGNARHVGHKVAGEGWYHRLKAWVSDNL